jgi:ubiquinone biosynthesis monooxygenase Coq7
MIRVNLAGEYGATRIYAGQLFVLGKDPTIEHMAKQEEEHLKHFHHMAIERRVRPSVLQPFWYIGGFAMGALSALMGRNAAHACTAAVETVIDDHYQSQLKNLSEIDDPSLKALITRCHADECEHRDIAHIEANEDLETTYPLLTHTIKTITETAIRLAKRF